MTHFYPSKGSELQGGVYLTHQGYYVPTWGSYKMLYIYGRSNVGSAVMEMIRNLWEDNTIDVLPEGWPKKLTGTKKYGLEPDPKIFEYRGETNGVHVWIVLDESLKGWDTFLRQTFFSPRIFDRNVEKYKDVLGLYEAIFSGRAGGFSRGRRGNNQTSSSQFFSRLLEVTKNVFNKNIDRIQEEIDTLPEYPPRTQYHELYDIEEPEPEIEEPEPEIEESEPEFIDDELAEYEDRRRLRR